MSFQETSIFIRLEADNHTLSAKCQTSDREWRDSSIDLNRFLGNNDGQFDTTGVNFATTAQDVRIESSDNRVLLNASLRTIDEQWNTNQSINLSEYIENHEGTLRFKN
ncbi:MAG: Cyanovirin-N [Benniella sp.]|nr:MAG: Cyanovirin-N [Benniella sp.]